MFSNKPLKGMTDYTPEKVQITEFITKQLEKTVSLYNYSKYDGPVMEPIDIFAAKSSEELVKQQSYSFTDKGGRDLILRPEMTPTLARMISYSHTNYPKPIRWYSIPTCYRYEKPQRGRMREFKQINVDILGSNSILADIEIFSIIVDFLTSFGANKKQFKIKYSNRKFIDHLLKDNLKLSVEQLKITHKVIDKCGKLTKEKFIEFCNDSLTTEISENIIFICFSNSIKDICKKFDVDIENEGIKELLEINDILKNTGLSDYTVFDPSIIRGLDYYTGNVFEVYDTGSKNSRALFGGGRYDNLTTLFSKEKISGTGFGMGVLCVELFLETYNLIPKNISELNSVDYYFIASKKEYFNKIFKLSDNFRKQGFSVEIDHNFGKFSKAFKNANKKKANNVCIIGEEEFENNTITIKNMKTGEQKTIAEKDF